MLLSPAAASFVYVGSFMAATLGFSISQQGSSIDS
jgi:hypothetical protein